MNFADLKSNARSTKVGSTATNVSRNSPETAVQKKYNLPPWGSHPPENAMLDIPWSKRDYCFDFKLGCPDILVHYDMMAKVKFGQGDDGKMRREIANVVKHGKAQNPYGYPLLTFDEVKAIHSRSAQDDVTLKVAFVLVKGQKGLSEEELRALANGPDIYAAKDDAAKVIEKANADAFDKFQRDLEAAKTKKAEPEKPVAKKPWEKVPAAVG